MLKCYLAASDAALVGIRNGRLMSLVGAKAMCRLRKGLRKGLQGFIAISTRMTVMITVHIHTVY